MFVVYLDSEKCIHHSVDQNKVNKYKDRIESGDVFPPIEVVEKNGQYFVLDGAHRAQAHQDLGQPILAMVYDWEDCAKRFLIGRRVSMS